MVFLVSIGSSMVTLTSLLRLFADRLAPFVRFDDDYSNILIPSVIRNQKGNYRPVINRRPQFLYKVVGLSTPESLLFLNRHEYELLKPLTEAVLSADVNEIFSIVEAIKQPSLSVAGVVQAVFRYLVVSGQDQQAIELAVRQSHDVFLKRCCVLLALADPMIQRDAMIDVWLQEVFDQTVYNGIESLFIDGNQVATLPMKTKQMSKIYFSLFQSDQSLQSVDHLLLLYSPVSKLTDRTGVKNDIFFVFTSFLSSGRLFAAFQLYRQIVRLSASFDLVNAMAEEFRRIALLNDCFGLYRRLEANAADESFRLSYMTIRYGRSVSQRIARLLNEEYPFVDTADNQTIETTRYEVLHNNFEDIVMSDNPTDRLWQNRDILIHYSGDDLRLRTLLGLLYEQSDKEEALFHYNVSSYPLVRQFLAMRLRSSLHLDAEKRDQNLRKMLASSSVGNDRGQGDSNEY